MVSPGEGMSVRHQLPDKLVPRNLRHAVCLYDRSGHTHILLAAYTPPELLFTASRGEKADDGEDVQDEEGAVEAATDVGGAGEDEEVGKEEGDEAGGVDGLGELCAERAREGPVVDCEGEK